MSVIYIVKDSKVRFIDNIKRYIDDSKNDSELILNGEVALLKNNRRIKKLLLSTSTITQLISDLINLIMEYVNDVMIINYTLSFDDTLYRLTFGSMDIITIDYKKYEFKYVYYDKKRPRTTLSSEFQWADEVGHHILKHAELKIDGDTICTYDSDIIDIYNALSMPVVKKTLSHLYMNMFEPRVTAECFVAYNLIDIFNGYMLQYYNKQHYIRVQNTNQRLCIDELITVMDHKLMRNMIVVTKLVLELFVDSLKC